ncbi:hypothetical protein VTH06DRAFT_255 [Thermothelomyces fergusii]
MASPPTRRRILKHRPTIHLVLLLLLPFLHHCHILQAHTHRSSQGNHRLRLIRLILLHLTLLTTQLHLRQALIRSHRGSHLTAHPLLPAINTLPLPAGLPLPRAQQTKPLSGPTEQTKTDGPRSKPEGDDPKVQHDGEQTGEGSLEDTNGWDPKLREEFKQAFPDIQTKPADPVGIPLPLEHTDEPTIPPAYNARCVKSEFFREDNKKDFGRSIREHPSWATLKNDPVFRHYLGMVMRRFPESEHEYPSYDPPDPPPSPSSIKMPPRFKFDRSAAVRTRQDRPEGHPADNPDDHRQPHSPRDRWRRDSGPEWSGGDGGRPRKRSFDAGYDRDHGEPDPKRARRRSPEDRGRTNITRSRSPSPPRFNIEGDPWSPQAGETNFNAPHDRRYQEVHKARRYSPPREERITYSDKRHDSGYQSGQSTEKDTPRCQGDEWKRRSPNRPYQRRASPPRDRDHRSRSRSRGRSRRRSRSQSQSRGRYRSASRGHSRGRSRASTPSRGNRGRSESPLTALEADLLGLARDSSEPETKPVAKKPVKRVQVAAAFGRRW